MSQAEGTTYVNVGSQAEHGTFEEEKEAHYCWRILARSWKDIGRKDQELCYPVRLEPSGKTLHPKSKEEHLEGFRQGSVISDLHVER